MASLSGAVEGNASQLSNIAANDVLPIEGTVSQYALPAYTSYAQYLNQITSQDPALRTKAAAPAIAQTTAQEKQVENQVRNLPRGGEQNYLLAQAKEGQATNVSNFLNSIFTSGQTARGELGQKGIADSLTAISDVGQLDSAAAQIETGQEQINAENWQTIAGALTDVGQMAAEAAAGG